MKHTTNNARIAIANFIISNYDKFYNQIPSMIYDPKVAQEKCPEWFDYMNTVSLGRINSIDGIHIGPEPFNFMVVEATVSDVPAPGTTTTVGLYSSVDDFPRLNSFYEQLFDLGMFAATCRHGVPHDWLQEDAPSKIVTHWCGALTDDPQLLHLIRDIDPTERFANGKKIFIPFTRKPAGKGLLNCMTAIPASVFWFVSARQRLPLLTDENVAKVLATQIAIHNDPAIMNTLGALDNEGNIFYSKTHMEQLAPVWDALFKDENIFERVSEAINSLIPDDTVELNVSEFNALVLSLIHWN